MRRLLAALLLLATPAAAQAPVPLLDPAAYPGLRAQDRGALNSFLVNNLPRALAVGPNGAGWQSGGGDAAQVEARALEFCQRNNAPGACRIVARDLSLQPPARPWSPAPPPTDAGLVSANRQTVPDERFLWWGPGQARGVLVFAHGRAPGQDSRGGQPQAWVRHFNNAGFDVFRFDRAPAVDEPERAAGWLREDLRALRGRGYRQVVAAGQSRGGWNSLMILDTPGLADVVIAIAPAAHGGLGSAMGSALDDLRRVVSAGAAGAPRARVAVVNFRDDAFDPDPEARGRLFRRFEGQAAGFLFLDRPEGVSGHGGGNTSAFSQRYGACLLRFATANPAPSRC
jgi:hypothetical protein